MGVGGVFGGTPGGVPANFAWNNFGFFGVDSDGATAGGDPRGAPRFSTICVHHSDSGGVCGENAGGTRSGVAGGDFLLANKNNQSIITVRS
jgi:hypothetical protein